MIEPETFIMALGSCQSRNLKLYGVSTIRAYSLLKVFSLVRSHVASTIC